MINSIFGKRIKYSTVPYRYRDEGEGTLMEFIAIQGDIKGVILKPDGSFVSAYLNEITLCLKEENPTK